ncbi:MAG: hypothetical protein P8Y99_06025 [Calditrichaceae bacterium]|jgi:hypothetical protein
MSKFTEFFKSPHIQIALATGISIIVMAVFSKYVLANPIKYLPLAIPPFITTLYEAVYSKNKDSKYATTWYWIVAIFIATALVIYFSM